MNRQNYLYLEYRRALKKFQKLQVRFEKRISKDTFKELSARKRYLLLSKIEKLKARIQRLADRLKLAVATGAVAFSVGMMANTSEALAQNPVKELKVDRTLVNSETSGNQSAPEVAMNDEGDYAIAWPQDASQVNVKFFNSCDVGQEVIVVDVATGAQNDPVIAMNNDGDAVVAWYDYNVTSTIKYRRYHFANDEIVASDVQSFGTSTGDLWGLDVAMDDTGNFAITWQAIENLEYDITARYVDVNDVQGSDILVANEISNEERSPAIDFDSEGNFIVVWQDDVLGSSQINSKKFQPSGTVDFNKSIELATNSSILKDPDIAINSDGSFVVVWDNEYWLGSIDAKRFDQDGVAIGGNISVEAQNSVATMGNPSIASNKDGAFRVVYERQQYGTESIFEKRFNQFGAFVSTETIQEAVTADFNTNPAIAMNSNGDFVVAWDDQHGSPHTSDCSDIADCDQSGIYYKKFGDPYQEGSILIGENVINNFSMSDHQNPSIDQNNNGDYVVAWKGFVSGEGDEILAQRFDKNGVEVGAEIHVGTNTANQQHSPGVAIDEVGNFIVVWAGNSETSYIDNISAQIFNADGTKNGIEFKVDEYVSTGVTHILSVPSVDYNDVGKAVIVWEDNQEAIKGRVVNGPNSFDGTEFQVNTDISSSQFGNPEVALAEDGNFVVAWDHGEYQVTGDYAHHIYIQRYDNNNNAVVGSEKTISQEFINYSFLDIELDDNTGSFLVAWSQNYQGTYSTILASKFDSSGNPVFESKLITSSKNNTSRPNIDANTNGEFAVVWNEYIDISTNYVKFSTFDAEGGNKNLRQQVFSSSLFRSPNIALNNDGDITVVASSNQGPYYDVYQKTFAAPTDPINKGNEFIVNSSTSLGQVDPDVARNANGDFVVVWIDNTNAIFAQQYNNEGVKQGAELTVSTNPGETVADPSVAMDADGNFMVVWTASYFTNGIQDDVIGSIFNAAGVETTDDFFINTSLSGNQSKPDVALTPDGNFHVVWGDNDNTALTQFGVRGQVVNVDGTLIGINEILVNNNAVTANNIAPSIAINDQGDYAISYLYADVISNSPGEYASIKVFDASGIAFDASEISLTIETNIISTNIGITADQDGDFTVAWAEYQGQYVNVMARKYDKTADQIGSLGSAISLKNWWSYGYSQEVYIAAVDDGDFITSYNNNSSGQVLSVQKLSSSLIAEGNEIIVNDNIYAKPNTSLAGGSDGNYIVAWDSDDYDGSGKAIVAKQFISHKPTVFNELLAVDEGSESAITTDGFNVLNDSGSDGDTFVTITSVPTNGSLMLNASEVLVNAEVPISQLTAVTYLHDGSETIIDSFGFTASNKFYTTNAKQFDITVNPVNDPPVVAFGLADFVMDEHTAYSNQIPADLFTDAEGAALSYSATLGDDSALPLWLSFDAGTRTLSGTPDVSGDIIIKITASDGSLSASTSFTLSVTEVNRQPVVDAEIANQNTEQYDPFSFGIPVGTFSDPDGDALTLSATQSDDSALPFWLTFSAAETKFTGTPPVLEFGTTSIKVIATDAGGLSATSTFDLVVNYVLDVNIGNDGQKIQVYPNPVEGILKIQLGDQVNGNAKLSLYNWSGQLVYNFASPQTNVSEIFELDLSHFEKGLYLLKIENGSVSQTFKISKK